MCLLPPHPIIPTPQPNTTQRPTPPPPGPPGVAPQLPDHGGGPDGHGHVQRLPPRRGHGRRGGHDHVLLPQERQEEEVLRLGGPSVPPWLGFYVCACMCVFWFVIYIQRTNQSIDQPTTITHQPTETIHERPHQAAHPQNIGLLQTRGAPIGIEVRTTLSMPCVVWCVCCAVCWAGLECVGRVVLDGKREQQQGPGRDRTNTQHHPPPPPKKNNNQTPITT